MNLLRLPMILLVTGVLGLAGCSVHQPAALYQLDSGEPGQPKQAAGLAVLLGPVSIADYLQRETLLQRQPDGTLTAAADGRWAGNLSSDIDQLLLRQISWKLDSQRVVLSPTVANFTPDVQVLLSITRLDSGSKQPAILDAQWRLLDRKGNVRDSRLVHLEEVHTGTTASQVKAQGILLQRLADQVSTAIKPISWAPVEEPKKTAPVVRAKPQPEKPKIPMASPIRTDLEVFRF
ncbi:ABC-type transport auxiliary lipoprotein family protein [Pseudomonas sp. 21LCFQ02]|uniref:PqiC family protein n=1 Tax=unclassified Pseudomonas TaxID=196821 RepID=UPI0004F7CF51|nr:MULTISPECIES: PqiC family protein [unclassified Pseudomonas]MCO8162698.1 ABC-type transport auxiliary lipoprotein family protein [Pseudomonas sp. 21LCFQ010]MCO8167752.1 ABC-type transport auxiliary lipoprotein family protein [Pseudomonas sp. 21LCFQ02]MCQ9424750.1 ABC-type transport auxiliary lipoprotein family protein [Pseudomonas sp. LJDD11]BAP43047.1 lipoprotein [Pseudomonas sp. StFLB209]